MTPHHKSALRLSSALPIALVAASLFATVAYANHSWGNYHWARQSNPFSLKLGDNVSTAWDPYLATTSSDWSLSSVLDTSIVAGQGRKSCRPTAGRVEVCNAKYGNNGWLGLAQIWVSGGHITQGTTKLNDTYFTTSTYNTPAWRNLVLCQEVGHTFGLNHQDENFGNTPLGSCMDYSSDPTLNQHPNAHDYEQLELIYAHLDSTTTVGSVTAPQAKGDVDDADGPPQWGKVIHRDGKDRASLFERDLGNGHKVFTFVFWADGEGEVH
ncbi:MAG: hypothetical protein Q7R81_05215 [Candidatus Peregrinibacteria bacterium]|nr:hypothetical protein [Candidatus Peregrinibacteria bacterium]